MADRRLMGLGLGLVIVLSIFYGPAFAQTSGANPVDVTIVIDPPTHNGEYLQSDNLSITLLFTNNRANDTLIHYSYWIKYIRADSSHSVDENTSNQIVAPARAITSQPLGRTPLAYGKYTL